MEECNSGQTARALAPAHHRDIVRSAEIISRDSVGWDMWLWCDGDTPRRGRARGRASDRRRAGNARIDIRIRCPTAPTGAIRESSPQYLNVPVFLGHERR